MIPLTYNTIVVLLGTGLLGAVAGMLGTFLVLRRRALIGDAMSHAALPGLFIAFLILREQRFAGLLFGAFCSALLGAWLVSAIRIHTRIKEDAAIGIVLSVLFGLGAVLLGVIQNAPGVSKAGLNTFIFGKAASMLRSDVIGIGAISLLVLIVILMLAKEFRLLSFDTEFATALGWPVLLLDMLMMGLACVVTIVGLPAVGVVLMAAMLIIPGAAARFWTDSLDTMLMLSGAFGLLTGVVGTFASAIFIQLPTGPIVILTGTAIFVISMLVAPRRGILARIARQLGLARRIENQNLLRTMYELSEDQWPEQPLFAPAELTVLRAWSPARARRLLRRAARAGWAREEGGRFALTKAGWYAAAQVVRVHRMWEIYLIEEAQVAPSFVDRDAERVEHVLPPETVAHLERRLAELNLNPPPLAGDVPPRHPAVASDERTALPGGVAP